MINQGSDSMLIDTHSHLHFAKYDEDRDQIHARMAEFDVKTITIGTAMNTSRSAVAYADKHADTWAAVGYHPDHVTSNYEDENEKGALDEPYDIAELEKLATSSPRVLAIGECGLDYHYLTPFTPPPCQGETVTGLPYIPYRDGLNVLSRELRNNQTAYEKIMWHEILGNKKLLGYKFTRQKPLDHYIADFYCSELLLVIEIDGDIHKKQKEQDLIRSLNLREFTIKVVRYTNEQVQNNLEYIKEDLQKIIIQRKKELDALLTSPLTRGFGGLGNLEDLESKKLAQFQVFNQQADLAAKLNKALIVHQRDAGEDIVKAISDLRSKYPAIQIVIHGFSDTWQQAQDFLDLNCYLGIGGIVTFKPRKTTAEPDILANIVKKMPLDRLLLETDCPWLAPVPVRGERNEPAHIRHIAQFIADLRSKSFTEICGITTNNAQTCFNCSFQ